MKKMNAKFNSYCAETDLPLRKGSEIYYDRTTKKAYHPSAKIVANLAIDQQQKNDSAIVQAQEEAFFDNFVQNDRNNF